MQISSIFEMIRRRWIPLVAVVLLSLVTASAAWVTTQVHYLASTVVVVVPPVPPGQSKAVNPLSGLGSSTTEMSSFAVTLVRSPEVADAMAAQEGGLVSVDNVLNPTSANAQYSSRITVVTEAPSSPAAVRTAAAAVTETQRKFAAFQTSLGVAQTSQAKITTLIEPTATTSDRSSRLRSATAAGIGTLMTGVALVLCWDIWRALQLRRRARTRVPVESR